MGTSVTDERLKAAERLLVAPGHVYCEQCSRKGTRVYHPPGHHATKINPEKPKDQPDQD